MELTRIIHPVGQGGFYSETLRSGSNEINVIYDCGGNDEKSMINYLTYYYPIKTFYPKVTKTIDAVFISHLHADHINGLQYLLNNCSVKYLFLPQLTINERLEVLLYNCKGSSISTSEVSSFLNILLDSDSYENTRIVRVSHYNGDDHVSDEMEEDISSIKENTTYIKSGTKIHFGRKWFFIPYNPPTPIITPKNKSFYDYFKEQLKIKDFDIKDLPNIVVENGINRCKKMYKDYFNANHNAYSMALFSGIAKSHSYFEYCDDCYYSEYDYDELLCFGFHVISSID